VSDFAVIRAVTKTLHNLLTEEITNSTEPALAGVPIDMRSPKQMKDDNNSFGVSLFLYRVIRDADLQNRPRARVSANQYKAEGVPVQLHYLLTPIQKLPEDEHTLLGRVLQVFNDFAVLRGADLQDILRGTDEQIRVTLEAMTVEDLTRVWTAMQDSYRLSVSYVVQVVTIDSDRELVAGEPVLTRDTTYTKIRSAG
jgi:hypothetical protein